MLAALGLTEADERLYRCVVDRGRTTVEDLATALGTPEGDILDSAARLRELGLLHGLDEGRLQAVNPQAALLPLLARRQLEVESTLASARTEIDRIAERYRAGRVRSDPHHLVEVLSDRELILERIEELTGSATTHVWALDRPPYVERPESGPHSNGEEFEITTNWLRRGIDVRSIYCPQSMDRPGRFATVLRLAELGERSRILPHLPFKLHIIDKRVALVPLSGPVYDDLLVIHPCGMLDALTELYEAYWARAEPIVGALPADGGTFGPDDLLLLGMLKAGLKDHAIARQLGCSTRTATRRVAAVLARLGVDTRFQAGVEAAARGLV
ncbi:transcriptional regulator [Streptomyces sp. NPDC093516]|uniref:transcriptional regulator n=1 Tax=Streptomyces sp. NPDC093516 TaxID=3155304 RepID=UPI00343789BC